MTIKAELTIHNPTEHTFVPADFVDIYNNDNLATCEISSESIGSGFGIIVYNEFVTIINYIDMVEQQTITFFTNGNIIINNKLLYSPGVYLKNTDEDYLYDLGDISATLRPFTSVQLGALYRDMKWIEGSEFIVPVMTDDLDKNNKLANICLIANYAGNELLGLPTGKLEFFIQHDRVNVFEIYPEKENELLAIFFIDGTIKLKDFSMDINKRIIKEKSLSSVVRKYFFKEIINKPFVITYIL